MMKDKNGVQIKAGDIVKIEGAFFKNDNGLYYVEQDGTNKAYCGRDHLTLYKICKNGKLSTTKYNICFFPIISTVSNHAKTAQANAWNKEHATIEIVYNVDNSKVIEKFEEEARQAKESSDYYKLRGCSESFTKCYDYSFEYYHTAAERMKAEKEQPKEEEAPTETAPEATETFVKDKAEEIHTEDAGTDEAEKIHTEGKKRYVETYTQPSTGQRIAVEEVGEKYYNVYGYDTKEVVKAGGFETIEKAREMM